MTDLWAADAVTLAGMLRRREVSAREVVAAHIDRAQTVGGPVNAIVTPTFEAALARAAAADEELARGAEPGLLHGLPVAHKDLHETAGVRTTYGSPLFADHVPAVSDLIIERMAAAGAISLGKTNVPEFGAGSHTVNPVFGATRNPWDLSRSAGGSSGGAAAALAARLVCLADGSDLGGSLRNPASFNNVVGFRPSPGRVPKWPFAEVAGVLGVSGPMARTVADVALLLAVQSGPTRGRRSPSTRRRPRWPRPPRRPGWSSATSRACGWPGARTSGCPSIRMSGPRWPRPGRSWSTWAARSSTPRRTCPGPTRRSGSCGPASSCGLTGRWSRTTRIRSGPT